MLKNQAHNTFSGRRLAVFRIHLFIKRKIIGEISNIGRLYLFQTQFDTLFSYIFAQNFHKSLNLHLQNQINENLFVCV